MVCRKLESSPSIDNPPYMANPPPFISFFQTTQFDNTFRKFHSNEILHKYKKTAKVIQKISISGIKKS